MSPKNYFSRVFIDLNETSPTKHMLATTAEVRVTCENTHTEIIRGCTNTRLCGSDSQRQSPCALKAEKAAILGAIRALPAGSQPNLSSLVYSRAALINHHTTDGIDFNPPPLGSFSLSFFLLLDQPYMPFSTPFSKVFHLVLLLCLSSCAPSSPCSSLALSLLFSSVSLLSTLLYTSHIIELE